MIDCPNLTITLHLMNVNSCFVKNIAMKFTSISLNKVLEGLADMQDGFAGLGLGFVKLRIESRVSNILKFRPCVSITFVKLPKIEKSPNAERGRYNFWTPDITTSNNAGSFRKGPSTYKRYNRCIIGRLVYFICADLTKTYSPFNSIKLSLNLTR
ncbi:hypothetical protein HUJ04_005050 [Dendroctonus ponderosae]|nr:hypothetical protein HUJ04_005050 [Dendroctonus ponderosae]